MQHHSWGCGVKPVPWNKHCHPSSQTSRKEHLQTLEFNPNKHRYTNGQSHKRHHFYKIPDALERSAPCPVAWGWCWLRWDCRRQPPRPPGLNTCPWVGGTWISGSGGGAANSGTPSSRGQPCWFGQAAQCYPRECRWKSRDFVFINVCRVKKSPTNRKISCTAKFPQQALLFTSLNKTHTPGCTDTMTKHIFFDFSWQSFSV